MPETHCFSEIRWFSEMASTAFCDSLNLRRVLLERQLPFGKSKRWPPLLEPSSAEFIAALAAGINSRHTLQVGCGLSTVALAAAARATGSCVLSVHHEKDKQRIVQYILKELGLSEFVEFITEDSASFIAHKEGVEFVLLSGVPERYIQLFDLLKLRKGAIVVADNALDDATNDYIRHVRRQPGVESSTLPLNRGIEVTKIVCWEDFQRGRKIYSGIDDPINNLDDLSRQPGLQGVSSNSPLSSGGPFFSQATADTRHSSQRANLVLVESKQKTPSVTLEGDSQKPSQKPDKCHDLDGSESCRPLTIQQHESDVPETSQQGELREFKDWNKEKAAGMDNTSGNLGKLDEHERTVGWEEISWNSQVESSIGSDQRVHPLEQDTSPSMQSPVHQLSVNSTACSDPCTNKLDKEHPLQQSHSSQWHESEGQGASSLADTMTSIVSGLKISEDTAGSYSLATCKFVADAVPCQPSAVAENEGVCQMDLENNGGSLPLSECSFVKKVAPELLEAAAEVQSPKEECISDAPSESSFKVYFKNDISQTEVTVEGVDQDMLLLDISLGFNETGVSGNGTTWGYSVQKAKIATQDNFVSDIFYVVDVGTRAPLLESKWEVVKNNILAHIAKRRQLLHAQ